MEQPRDVLRFLLPDIVGPAFPNPTNPPDPGPRCVLRGGLPPGQRWNVLRLLFALLHPSLKNVVHPLQDGALGTEILHQVKGVAVHPLLQPLHLSNVGPPEPVDGLLGVAHHKQLALFGSNFQPGPGPLLRRGSR